MADILSIDTDELNDKQRLDSLITGHKSFQVVGIRSMDSVVQTLEAAIEKQGMKVRVYTAFRRALFAGLLIPTFITQVVAVITAVGTGVHNAATFNPDYEIVKNVPMSKAEVLYKK